MLRLRGEFEMAYLNFIQFYRKRAGYNQSALSDLIGVSTKTVSRWEKCTRDPRASEIKKLCEVLNVSETELLAGPKQEGFSVALKFAATLSGATSEILFLSGIALTIADDGFLGVAGGMIFQSLDDIETVLREIRFKLEHGYDERERMRADRESREGVLI
jgi:transcriptional regulator with XRE-family HTH domain